MRGDFMTMNYDINVVRSIRVSLTKRIHVAVFEARMLRWA
jgi:uncharacterized membrane-anchored protein